MPRDRRRRPLPALALLVLPAAIVAGAFFVHWATRPVPHGECVVAYSRIAGDGTRATGRELDAIVQRAHEKAIAEGRCAPPWPRWRGWAD
jgi:hypothetical protein